MFSRFAGLSLVLIAASGTAEAADPQVGQRTVPDPSPIALPAPANQAKSAAPPEYQLADGLLSGVPGGSKVALRPLTPRETGLSKEVGGRLYEKILSGLFARKRRSHVILTRVRLNQVYGSLEEFYHPTDIHPLLRAAQADVEIFCSASPTSHGTELSCSAVSLTSAQTLGRGQALFDIADATVGVPLESALIRLANDLDTRITQPGLLIGALFRDQHSGEQSALGGYIASGLMTRLRQRLNERFQDQRRNAIANEALGSGKRAQSPAGIDYRLNGIIWYLSKDKMSLDARLLRNGRIVAQSKVQVLQASIPEYMREAAAMPAERLEAIGEAVISDRLDRKAARRAARNLARGRIVARALGIRGPGVTVVETESDAAQALTSALGHGIPVEEQFRKAPVSGPGRRLATRLRARVIPVGAIEKPAITANLNKTVYRELEPISIDIESESGVYVGVFAWGADNKVVRLYPNSAVSLLHIPANEILHLPRTGENQIVSAPLPERGNMEDHEAIIVVASSRPMDFNGIAREAGDSLATTMEQSVSGSAFFTALSKRDPSRMAMVFLPYQVGK